MTDSTGGYFARAAALEAASVAAFRRLGSELKQLGAPEILVTRSRRAARDEVAHARLMGRLARRFGAEPERLAMGGPIEPRDLEAIAVENSVEGCVRETFGAAVAMWQSLHARDPDVRLVMTTVAEDEVSHAQLAWEVAAWLEDHLSESGREGVRRARERSIRELEAELRLSPPTIDALGLPDATTGLRLFYEVLRGVWS